MLKKSSIMKDVQFYLQKQLFRRQKCHYSDQLI